MLLCAQAIEAGVSREIFVGKRSSLPGIVSRHKVPKFHEVRDLNCMVATVRTQSEIASCADCRPKCAAERTKDSAN
jgi:hypothetical protein